MTLLFVVMTVIACLIPHRLIDSNIRQSLSILEEEGRYPFTCGLLPWARDNITDGTMYNIAVSGYDMTPLQEAMENPWTFEGSDQGHTATFGLAAMNTRDGSVTRTSYGRYWHGYQLPLRLSSIFLSINGQRVMHSIILWLLLLVTTLMILRRYGRFVAAGWIIIMVVIGFPVVPLSLQYLACYYIMLISVTAMLLRPSLFRSPVMFFIIGGTTAFFDFLTVPLITLGLPLALAIYDSGRKATLRLLITLILAWGFGYCGLWATKWILQIVVLHADALGSVVHAGSGHTIFTFFPEGFHYKYFKITASFLLLALIATIAVYIFCRRDNCNNSLNIRYLMIVAMIPFCWYVLFLGHNTAHIWFTYRSLSTPLFCCWLMLALKFASSRKLYPRL